MAIVNASTIAGNNGVCGPSSPSPRTGNDAVADANALPIAAVTGTLAGNNLDGDKSTALRFSVAGTQGGAVALKSEVYSETMCFRTAYVGQDGDTGVEADGGDTQARGD